MSQHKDEANLSFFGKLPKEIQMSIFSNLPTSDLLNVIKTSKTIKKVADSDDLWKVKCQQSGTDLEKDQNPKGLYKSEHTLRGKNYFVAGDFLKAKTQKEIARKDVINSFPKGITTLFSHFELANVFGRNSYNELFAIFEVQLKFDTKMENKTPSTINLSKENKIKAYSFNTDVANVEKHIAITVMVPNDKTQNDTAQTRSNKNCVIS